MQPPPSGDLARLALPSRSWLGRHRHPLRSILLLALGAVAAVAGLMGAVRRVGEFQQLDFRVVPVPEGLLVVEVAPRSGAARAGLVWEDVLVGPRRRRCQQPRGAGAGAAVPPHFDPQRDPPGPAARDRLLPAGTACRRAVLARRVCRDVHIGDRRRRLPGHIPHPTRAVSCSWPRRCSRPSSSRSPQQPDAGWQLPAAGPRPRPPCPCPPCWSSSSLGFRPASSLLAGSPSPSSRRWAWPLGRTGMTLGLLPPVLGNVLLFEFLDRISVLLAFLGVAAAAALAVVAYVRHRANPTRRRQVEWVALGAAAGFTPYLLLSLIPQMAGAELEVLTWVSLLPLTLVPLGVASSLLEFRLWDLEDITRQVVATGIAVLAGRRQLRVPQLPHRPVRLPSRQLAQPGGRGRWCPARHAHGAGAPAVAGGPRVPAVPRAPGRPASAHDLRRGGGLPPGSASRCWRASPSCCAMPSRWTGS